MSTPLCSVDKTQPELTILVVKRKKTCARNASEVRHINRLAGLSASFKDKDAADRAAGIDAEKGKAKKIIKNTKKTIKKNLNVSFTPEIVDSSAPPPPKLPLSTVEAIGVQQC
jgi:hypothetical protein